MANGQPQTRYHAEVKGRLNDEEVRVNVFADTLNEIFLDIGKVHSQLFEAYRNPGKREIANAELKAKKQPAANPEQTGEIPVCEDCSTPEFMQLIHFNDKKTGQPRQAWKCQQCQKWDWNNNGKGR